MIQTLTGDNSYALKDYLSNKVNDFVTNYGDISLERIDGQESDYLDIVQAMQNLPFLSTRKLVVLKNPGANKTFVENLPKLLKTVPESTDVVILEPKLDKRSKYYKSLKKTTEFKSCDTLDNLGLARWLVNQANVRGGSLSLSNANHLINKAGSNQQFLSNELDKLLLAKTEIDRELIDKLASESLTSTIFNLLDSAFSGQKAAVVELYRQQRLQKTEPLSIIGLLAWQLHVLALIKTAGDIEGSDIARQAKLNPYAVKKSFSLAKSITLDQIKQLVDDLQEIEFKGKKSEIDLDLALTNYLLEMSELRSP